ncbi:MAG: hypothetical protein Q9163_003796 [Psora crenata]
MLHIPHLAASAVAPQRDARKLPNIGSDQDAKSSLELIEQEQKERGKLRARSMEKIKKSISCLQKPFEIFNAQRDTLGVTFLMRPSPSFSTAHGRWDNGDTADSFNLYALTVRQSAFVVDKAVMFDHLHHLSHSFEQIEDTQSQILRRHESFTFDILDSPEAKVLIVYSAKAQKRLL